MFVRTGFCLLPNGCPAAAAFASTLRTTFALTGAIGPAMAGVLRDRTGSYSVAAVVMAVSMLLSATLLGGIAVPAVPRDRA